jgi:S-adenosylmethionine:tRNA ribosyltransferase-isomerase
MRPQDISIKDYTYHLPNDRIAQHPLPKRDASKLLVYKNGNISQDTYRNIANHLPENSLLVINTTRVVRARILFQKPTGGVIEIFCLAPHEHNDITWAMSRQQKVFWQCLIGGASKWKAGQVLEKTLPQDKRFLLNARYVEKLHDSFIIEFSWEPKTFTFAETINAFGVLPLPPYIKRDEEEDDASRYQTIYGKSYGSVAAPTAGLHFTEQVFKKIKAKNIVQGQVTLHVGAGTFKPVKSETMAGHDMHEEYFEASREIISQLMKYIDEKLPITVTGTTSLRAIESLYWLGVKLILHPDLPTEQWTINQWEAYELEKENIPVLKALQTLYQKIEQSGEDRVIARTQLLIAPGYSIKIPSALITNFHQPQSTLLLLVAAFIGKDWRKIYDYALENDFRFLSYGDGCLLFRD